MEQDTLNIEKEVREGDCLAARGCSAGHRKHIFEEEPMRMINMVTSVHLGGTNGSYRPPRGIMEYKVIQNFRAVNGDTGLFRQWHQNFTTALGQVRMEYEETVHRLAKDIDLGRDIETVLTTLAVDYGAGHGEASQDLWTVLIDKAEAEAYGK